MRIQVLATDYDSSLASLGRVSETTLAALRKLKATGRKVMLVTGRRMDDLISVFPNIDICDIVVAENGAVLYWPQTREKKLLGEVPSPEFVGELRKAKVDPLVPGMVILATLVSQQEKVNAVFAKTKAKSHGILNKEALMILPEGVDKASGMLAALEELGVSSENCIAIGDAENDECMLLAAGLGIAVNNSLTSLKEVADLITQAPNGNGVTEVIERVLQTDLSEVSRRPRSRRT